MCLDIWFLPVALFGEVIEGVRHGDSGQRVSHEARAGLDEGPAPLLDPVCLCSSVEQAAEVPWLTFSLETRQGSLNLMA